MCTFLYIEFIRIQTIYLLYLLLIEEVFSGPGLSKCTPKVFCKFFFLWLRDVTKGFNLPS